jgi:hypothetical protein
LLNPILSRFCEIYVPEPENSISYHQQKLAHIFPQLDAKSDGRRPVDFGRDAGTKCRSSYNNVNNDDDDNIEEDDTCLAKFFSGEERKKSTPLELMNLATKWCEQGKSALHLIRKLDTRSDDTFPWDREHINLVVLCFYKIKDDIRHEKMLVFHVLFMIELCSKTDIKNMLKM